MVALKEERVGLRAFSFTAVIKGVLAALVITVLGSALLGVTYQFTGIAERSLPVASAVLFYLSILAGSLLAARDAGAGGLLHGIVVAVLFLLLGWLIAGLFFNLQGAPGSLLLRGGLSCVAGAVGGILGVGLSR